MSAYQTTFFLEARTHVRGNGLPNPVLYVEPDGWHGPGCISLQVRNNVTAEERVQIAENFLKGVTAWRDSIVEQAERERTAADELELARAEIARLKSEAGEVE